MKKHMEANKHKQGKAHHKAEMEHHKLRDSHKAAHMQKASQAAGNIEYSKEVNDNHQQGIERVKQRKGDMPVGQHGSMADGWRHERHKE